MLQQLVPLVDLDHSIERGIDVDLELGLLFQEPLPLILESALHFLFEAGRTSMIRAIEEVKVEGAFVLLLFLGVWELYHFLQVGIHLLGVALVDSIEFPSSEVLQEGVGADRVPELVYSLVDLVSLVIEDGLLPVHESLVELGHFVSELGLVLLELLFEVSQHEIVGLEFREVHVQELVVEQGLARVGLQVSEKNALSVLLFLSEVLLSGPLQEVFEHLVALLLVFEQGKCESFNSEHQQQSQW